MGYKTKAVHLILCLFCAMIVFLVAACSKDADAISLENYFEHPVSDITEIEIISYSQTGEEQRVLYSDGESLISIYDILNTVVVVVGDQVAFDPNLRETVEIIIKYSNESQQSFNFNDGCFLVDGKCYLLKNESVLVDSQYWPNK